MDFNLKGKVALVSGSGRGIGRAIAELLLAEGCVVFVNDSDTDVLNVAIKKIKESFPDDRVHGICGDLTSSGNIKAALETVFSKTGRVLDVAVANIGSGRSVIGWDVDDGEWLRMLDLNFLGAVRLCREAIRVMKDNGGGSIVCIASIAGCETIRAPVPYSAAKAALLSFVKSTSDSVAEHNIRINAVSPGNVLFEGGVWDIKIREDRDSVMNYINSVVPMKGFASTGDIARIVAFLVSDSAKFITGANFIVDGGQTRKFT